MGAMSSIFSIKTKVGAHKHRNPEIPDEFIKAVLCSRFHRDDKIGLVSSLKGDRSKKGLSRARRVFFLFSWDQSDGIFRKVNGQRDRKETETFELSFRIIIKHFSTESN